MVQQVPKPVSFVFSITLLVLTLLPFIRASQEHAETDISHTIKKHNMRKILPVFLATTGAILSIRNFDKLFPQ